MRDGQELFVDSVACRFGNKTVLSSVFINCNLGEVVGLLGRNGSGKSTLLKIIFGTLDACYKYTVVNGKRYDKGYRTRALAYLPQDPWMPNNIRVKKAVQLMTDMYTAKLLQDPFILERLNIRLGKLSGGERRMIETLLILYSDAQYILLDEPFSNVDPLYIEQLYQHIEKLKPEKGFILTDHYYDRILQISDRITLLQNGCNYLIQSRQDLSLYGYLPLSKVNSSIP